MAGLGTPREALFRDGPALQEGAASASRRQRAAMMGQLRWLRPEEMRWPLAQGEVGLAEAVRSGLGGMVRDLGMLEALLPPRALRQDIAL